MTNKKFREKWQVLQISLDEAYLAELDAIDPLRTGMKISCPNCQQTSWIKLSRNRHYLQPPIKICCPHACGFFGDLHSFGAHAQNPPADLDIQEICRRDGTEFNTSGKIFRCPVCAIENPREIMIYFVNRVKLISESATQEDLSEKLGSLVSVFDGVMRASNKIACENAVRLGHSHPEIGSFQDIYRVQTKLLQYLDLSACVNNWSNFVTTFQKRHAFSHTLGVADEKFIAKTGVDASLKGRALKLTRAEVIEFAEDCEKIVKRYFAMFLS